MPAPGRGPWVTGAIVGCVLTIGIETLLLVRVFGSGCNHWSFDVRAGLALPAVFLIFAGVGRFSRHLSPARFVLCGVLAVVLGGSIFICDHWNALVEYERWLDRGMPEKWTRA